ncbi:MULTISPECIES: acetyl-CoA carboxylase [unclassified Mesorhizobium]|uniref:acetyl-CoA carboxylase n=1 Tax=unclassified Mesorhizobium TaxID=325217 RepID=UPI000F7648A8|nr:MULTISPECIES: acetyl-CoA carboxylase [unclassified Mesorhizobium]AZO73492.1 biotin carboxyl carrier domain-containing protein [Mesorhizobium sp. M1D.F.Ca.ET.043.01.1.1]RWX72309.1 biotin carboxyl carrier domain-containing protein [Mesorhizobium sp. M2A.F.Ca.ET.039.01.1.1]
MTLTTVPAPIPGVFYRSESPDKPPFKSEGDAVTKGDVVGLIEVMKTFTQIEAEEPGRFVRYLVDDEEAVVPGQPLYELET